MPPSSKMLKLSPVAAGDARQKMQAKKMMMDSTIADAIHLQHTPIGQHP